MAPQHGPARHGRFDAALIARRVEQMRVACGLTASACAEAVGLNPSEWSKKMRLNQTSFTNEELGLIAEHFSKVTGRLLIGWPFVDEAVSALLESRRR